VCLKLQASNTAETGIGYIDSFYTEEREEISREGRTKQVKKRA
jgi:hypothetical protein